MKSWHWVLIVGLVGAGFAFYWFKIRVPSTTPGNPEAKTESPSPAQSSIAAAASAGAGDVVGMTLQSLKMFPPYFNRSV